MPEAPKYPTIPVPQQSLSSLQETVLRLKEAVEQITGQRGPQEYSLPEGLSEIRRMGATATSRITDLTEIVASANEALAQRTSILEAELTDARGNQPDLAARITQVDTARAAGDTALTQSVLTVEAQAGDGTAQGRVILKAEANPLGTLASYGWYITANGQRTGMSANVRSDGLSEITFEANRFMLTDPNHLGGQPSQVFAYIGGAFRFAVPVQFDGSVLFNGSVAGIKLSDLGITTPKLQRQTVNVPYSVESSTIQAITGPTGGWYTLLTRSAGNGGDGAYAHIHAEVEVYRENYDSGNFPDASASIRIIDNFGNVLWTGGVANVPSSRLIGAGVPWARTTAITFDTAIPASITYTLQFAVTSGEGGNRWHIRQKRLLVEVRRR